MKNIKITRTDADALNQECIADKMRLLNRVITSLYDDALRPVGLTTSQMNIMVVVAKYGLARPTQVGDWLRMEKSTLSRNLDRVRKQGWLRTVPGDHGRSIQLELTAKGQMILKKGLPLWRHGQQKARTLLGGHGVKEVMRMGNTVRQKSLYR